MIGLDSNILLQLSFDDHPAHASTVAAVDAEAAKGTVLVLTSQVINEFLHVATDDRRFSPPLAMTDALDWMQDFLAKPSVKLAHPTRASVDQALAWMRTFRLGRKRILDTHLAAIFHTGGVRRILTSNPADFAVFGVFEIVTP